MTETASEFLQRIEKQAVNWEGFHAGIGCTDLSRLCKMARHLVDSTITETVQLEYTCACGKKLKLETDKGTHLVSWECPCGRTPHVEAPTPGRGD